MAKDWISGAIRRPGALTKKAKKAGESPMAFAKENADEGGTTGKQSRLALTLSRFKKKKGGGGKKNKPPKSGPHMQADALERGF